MPAARLRDWIGCTTMSASPRPTVRPIATEMSCSPVWKPDRYTAAELPLPLVLSDANVSSPPFPSPDGSWKRMPVI
jgi:hypothetical protein